MRLLFPIVAVLLAPLLSAAEEPETAPKGEMAQWEYQLARGYDTSPNQAVCGMSRERYREVMTKVPAAFRLQPEERRASVQYGIDRHKVSWDRLSQPWRKGGVQSWPTLLDLMQKGWAKRADQNLDLAKIEQEPPDHYLSFSLETSDLRRDGDRFGLQIGEREVRPNDVSEAVTQREVYTPPDEPGYQREPEPDRRRKKKRRKLIRGGSSLKVVEDAQAKVVFDMLGSDGTPRIPATLDEVSFLVYRRDKTTSVTFRLADWSAAALSTKK